MENAEDFYSAWKQRDTIAPTSSLAQETVGDECGGSHGDVNPSYHHDMIDRDRIRAFMRTFFGYGSWNAFLWFIGIEEGGGKDLGELAKRLDAWDGKSELVDIREYHRAIGGEKWFDERPPIQSTWGKLAAIALSAHGRDTDRESIRRYQRDELGRGTALVELFPLPSPSTRHWIYGDLAMREMAERDTYYASLADHRRKVIRTRIDDHRPAAIVLYGIGHRQHWEKIAENEFESLPGSSCFISRRGATVLILAPHPAARGVSTETFVAIGRHIAKALRQRQG